MPQLLRALFAVLACCPLAFAQTPEAPELIWEDSPMTNYYNHGHDVAWLGDVDGDETDDFAGSTMVRGTVRVYSGQTREIIARLPGLFEHGFSVVGLGDLNADQVPDFAASNPYANSDTGEVRVYSGADFSILYTIHGTSPGDELGMGMERVDDTDGDGVSDLIVRLNRDWGIIHVYSGATGAFRYTIPAVGPIDFQGWGMAGIHDYNADGAADFLIGSPNRGDGEAVLHSGADGSVLARLRQAQSHEFGDSICTLPDINGDQVPDIAIGAPETYISFLPAGQVYFYSGADLSLIHQLPGTEFGERFGDVLANGGDYNGDGIGDLLVAGTGADGPAGINTGRVQLYSGADYSVLGEVWGVHAWDYFPSSMDGAGDAHHDLQPEYLLGNFRAGGLEQGTVQLWGLNSPWLQVDPLLAGQSATLSVSGCEVGSTVSFYASLQGKGPTPTPFGVALLSHPFRALGSTSVMPDGTANWSDIVPQALLFRQVDFQAVEFQAGGGVRLTTATGGLVQ